MEQSTVSDASKPVGTSVGLWRMFKVVLFIAPMLGLGFLNVATLVNDQAHAMGVSFLRAILAPALAEEALSRLLSHSPTQKFSTLEKSHKALESKHVELRKVTTARSQVVRNVSSRIGRRAVLNAGKNVASYAAEIIPFIGVAAITALTISDLYDDCQTLKDLNELNVSFEQDKSDESSVCGIKFPP